MIDVHITAWRRASRLLFLACASMLLLGCSGGAMLAALTPGGGSTAVRDVAYGEHPRARLDLYLPASAPQTLSPTLIFFYGGSWNRGSKDTYQFVGKAMASRGIATVIADYRLYPEVRFPAFLQDNANAVAWTLQHATQYGLDTKRIFLGGHSAGAYNAMMLCLDARYLQAAGLDSAAIAAIAGFVGLAGPYNFLPIKNPDVQPVFFHPDYPPATQPVDLVSPGGVPAFLGVADSDDLVNPDRNSGVLRDRLTQAGVSVMFKRYKRVNHVTLAGSLAWPLRWLAPVHRDVVDFILTSPGRP